MHSILLVPMVTDLEQQYATITCSIDNKDDCEACGIY